MKNSKKTFDPQEVDKDFYSNNPYQHGDPDFGRESEGVGTNAYKDSASEVDIDSRNYTTDPHDTNRHKGNPSLPTGKSPGTMKWDVDAEAVVRAHEKPHKTISDEAARKFNEVAENPSDDALFHRSGATYLEDGDDPGKGYDPHHMGYDKNERK